MREPPRRGVVRPCKQTKSRQWHRPPNNDGQHAKLVSEQCLTSSNDPWSLQPAKATAVGTLLVGSFSTEEEDLLIKLHALLGNRWSLIAGRLPGRTGEEVRNHWDSQMRAKLKRMGVDPDNHHVRQNEWDEHRAKHPGHSPASSEDGDIDAAGDCVVSDAGSSNGARQGTGRLAELNLELTLSTPYVRLLQSGDREIGSRH